MWGRNRKSCAGVSLCQGVAFCLSIALAGAVGCASAGDFEEDLEVGGAEQALNCQASGGCSSCVPECDGSAAVSCITGYPVSTPCEHGCHMMQGWPQCLPEPEPPHDYCGDVHSASNYVWLCSGSCTQFYIDWENVPGVVPVAGGPFGVNCVWGMQ